MRVYAYDAASGRKLWETDLGASHVVDEAAKQTALITYGSKGGQGSGGRGSAVVVADPAGSGAGAVVVLPTYDHWDSGLCGLDPETGRKLWSQPHVQSKFATPAVWSHAGRQYLLTASRDGKFRMLDPKDGRILWTAKIAPTYKPVITSENHAFVLVPMKSIPARLQGEGAPIRLLRDQS